MRKRWSENKKEQRCRKKLIDEETFKFEIANKKRSERLKKKMDYKKNIRLNNPQRKKSTD